MRRIGALAIEKRLQVHRREGAVQCAEKGLVNIMLKRITAFLLIALLLCGVLCACGETSEPLSGTYLGPKGEEYTFTKRSFSIVNYAGNPDITQRGSYRIVVNEDGTETITITVEEYGYTGLNEDLKNEITRLNNELGAESADRQTEYKLTRAEGYIMFDKMWLMKKPADEAES